MGTSGSGTGGAGSGGATGPGAGTGVGGVGGAGGLGLGVVATGPPVVDSLVLFPGTPDPNRGICTSEVSELRFRTYRGRDPSTLKAVIRFPAIPESVPKARRNITGHLEELGLENDLVDRVRLGLTEAVANAVAHAYRDGEAGDVEVLVFVHPETLVVIVEDTGSGPLPHPDGTGLGMGLSLMSVVSDKLEIEGERDRGTTVRMTFDLPGLPGDNDICGDREGLGTR